MKLKAPNAFQTFQPLSGTTYTSDANSIISSAAVADVPDLIRDGCEFLPGIDARNNLSATTTPTTTNDSSQNYAVGSVWLNTATGAFYLCTSAAVGAATWALSGTAMGTTNLNVHDFRNADGTVLTATAAATNFALTVVDVTSIKLSGTTANNSTATNDAYLSFTMPDNYTAGKNLTLTANVAIVTGGAPGYTTKTFQAKVFKVSTAGAYGADIGPGTTAVINAAGSDLTAAIAGATLSPGDRIIVEVETILAATGAVNCNTVINSVRLG